MFKRIAQFFLWMHIRATLIVSGIILVFSILYRIGINLLAQRSSLNINTGAFLVINTLIVVLGILAFFIFILSYMLYRRRKIDGSLDAHKMKK